MKRVLAGLLIVIGVAITGLNLPVSAQEVEGAQSSISLYNLEAGKTHEGNLYTSASNVVINGDVNGSLYCISASSVVINGKVNGDIVCAANRLTVKGEVAQDARLAGVYVNVDGRINGDTSIASSNKATVGDESIIGGDLHIYSSSVEVKCEVANDVYISSTDITVGPLLKVGGNFNYSAVDEVSFSDGQVKGNVTYSQVEHQRDKAIILLVNLLMLLALAMVIVLILPGKVNRSSELAKSGFGMTLLAGCAVLFLTPVVALVALVTMIGAPIAIVLILTYVIILILSAVFFSYFLGSLLLSGVKNIPLRMLGGVVFFVALCVIPIVNFITIIAAGIVGTGMIARLITDGYTAPRYSLNPPVDKPPMPEALAKFSNDTELNKSSKTDSTVKKSTKKTTKNKSKTTKTSTSTKKSSK